MKAYYNEIDKKTADWLRQLIKNGIITDGVVDDRSITEVTASDIKEFNRVHWFAGIGTWDYALNKAGWGDREIWTASLPCQPFSTAGKKQGKSDERHLLPHYLELVRQCKPDTQFGEQVESAIRHGWLDDLQTNMEAEGYAVGHCVLGAHSVNSPHQRQRLYWVADTKTAPRLRAEQGNNRESYSGVFNERSDGLDWIYCRDNKYRPIKPCIFPLVNGTARGVVSGSDPIRPNDSAEARAMRLKGYGNAIVAPLAIEFISAFMEVRDE